MYMYIRVPRTVLVSGTGTVPASTVPYTVQRQSTQGGADASTTASFCTWYIPGTVPPDTEAAPDDAHA